MPLAWQNLEQTVFFNLFLRAMKLLLWREFAIQQIYNTASDPANIEANGEDFTPARALIRGLASLNWSNTEFKKAYRNVYREIYNCYLLGQVTTSHRHLWYDRSAVIPSPDRTQVRIFMHGVNCYSPCLLEKYCIVGVPD